MKIGDKNHTLTDIRTRTFGRSACPIGHPMYVRGTATGHKEYAMEFVRQLEIVTIRNPQLAQYVKWVSIWIFVFRFVHFVSSYLDIFINEKYSFTTVLAELARCLSLFQNLHTVQIDGDSNSGSGSRRREIFEQTFKKYTYPQIRNVFVTDFSAIFIASCPQARRVGITTTSHIIPTFGFRSIQVCMIYKAAVLIWKYLKTLAMFFWHTMLAIVRNLYLSIALRSYELFPKSLLITFQTSVQFNLWCLWM